MNCIENKFGETKSQVKHFRADRFSRTNIDIQIFGTYFRAISRKLRLCAQHSHYPSCEVLPVLLPCTGYILVYTKNLSMNAIHSLANISEGSSSGFNQIIVMCNKILHEITAAEMGKFGNPPPLSQSTCHEPKH